MNPNRKIFNFNNIIMSRRKQLNPKPLLKSKKYITLQKLLLSILTITCKKNCEQLQFTTMSNVFFIDISVIHVWFF